MNDFEILEMTKDCYDSFLKFGTNERCNFKFYKLLTVFEYDYSYYGVCLKKNDVEV